METSAALQISSASFLRKKWAIFFRYMDRNKDGLLDYDEVMCFPNKLIELRKETVGNKVKTVYNQVWERMCAVVKIRPNESLTEQKWVDACDVVWRSAWFIETVVPCLTESYFKMLDTDEDGYISLPEWRFYQNSRGITEDRVIQATFNRLDTNQDGRISGDEMKHAITEFSVGGNPNEDYSFLYQVEENGQ